MSQKIQFLRKTAVVANYAAALAAAKAKKPLYGEPVVIKYTNESETLLALFIGIDGAGLVHEVGSFKDIKSLEAVVNALAEKVGDVNSLGTASKTNLVAAINEVNNKLAQAVAGGVTSVVAGAGVDVDSSNVNAPKVSAKVATSENGNILVVDETKGLYATLDFAYDSGTQKLTLSGSNGFSKVINLAIPAVVKAGAYDAANNEIVLTFTDNSTVKIPARDLIDEWKVASTATLELIREAASDGNVDYVLKGNVKVSAESGNTLIAKADGLYVAATDLSGLTARVVALENTVGDASKGLVKAVADNAAAAAAAQKTADKAVAAAATADGKAVAAQTAADNAQTAADNAQEAAATADGKAVAAQTTANKAVADAATADGKAVAAQTAADTAQTAAETADSKAVAAQNTANQAASAAATAAVKAAAAQNTANTNAEAIATIKIKDVDGTSIVKNDSGVISVNVIDGGEF